MIQPIITGAESRSAWALDKTSLGAKEGGWELEAHGRKNSAAAVPRWNGGRLLKKKADGDGGGLGKLSAAAASVGVASPALGASPQHTDTSRAPASPPTPSTKPSPRSPPETRAKVSSVETAGGRGRRSRVTSAPAAFVLRSLPVALRHPHAESRLTMRGKLA